MCTLKCLYTIIIMLICVCVYLLRLASEGVQSILPSPRQGQSPGVRGHAWGCVSLSDVLLLVEVKYDVVTHLLYTEMLQEHYSKERFLQAVVTIQHRQQSHNSKYNLLSIIEPGPDASYSCFSFFCGTTALSIWETLLPWQQHKEEEGLEDLAEEALESGDMLRLAELPGAFRIYR